MFERINDATSYVAITPRRIRDRKAERRQAWRRLLLGTCLVAVVAVATWLAGLPPLQAFALFVGLLAIWLAVADRFMRIPGGVPVLTWHSVSRDSAWLPWSDQISVTPETLDRQLSLLRRMKIQAMDSVDFLYLRKTNAEIPKNTAVLHFDDGYLDNWVAAAPILQRHKMCATVFISLDFVAPDGPLRPTLSVTPNPKDWQGYMNWQEIRALERGAFGGVVRVEPHGVDHARIVTGPKVVTHLNGANWRRLAWVQWAKTPGDKHLWFRHAKPWAVPLGTAVYQSDGALAAPGWTAAGRESQAQYAGRVRRDLRACRKAFAERLGKTPRVFCWPQNLTSPLARDVAADEGFLGTTGGRGANRPDEDASVISRVHIGERVAGFRWPWADDLALRASIRCFQGNHYWYLPLAAIGLLRSVVRRAAPRGGAT